ncbi:biosynthetic-type acetolactate synthase large subunit [Vagococcus sp. JNUCC 83]
MNKKGTELFIDSLLDEDVEMIFGYPGGAVLPLYDSLYDKKIPHILTRHEQGAIHAAEGYAKASGKPGVVLVTSGPGATNVVTGIADAMSDSVPLIVFTGQVASSGIGKDAFQEADILGLTIPITKYNYQVRNVEDLPKVIKEAFHIATTGRKGPVVIDLPKDITLDETPVKKLEDVHIPSYQPNYKPHINQIKKVVTAINESTKPVFLVGAGIHHSDATQEFRELLENSKIPVISTLLGLGIVPTEDELFLGMGGMHGSYAANQALMEADLLINIGSRFDDRLASCPTSLAKDKKIIHVDIDPAEIGKIIPTDIPIVGDAKEFITLLNNETFKTDDYSEWRETVKHYQQEAPYSYEETVEEIKPQKVIELIGEITNGDAIIATDVGQHQMWTAQFYPFKHQNQLITSGGLGTMGYGIPAGIGAQLADPDKQVVIIVGDGGFQMTNQELAILEQYGLSPKIVLINNHSLGMVRQWQESFFNERRSESVFDNQPDFQKMAEAYHLKSVKLDNAETLEDELTQAFKEKEPMVIEINCSPTEHVLPMVPPGRPNNEMIGVVKR